MHNSAYYYHIKMAKTTLTKPAPNSVLYEDWFTNSCRKEKKRSKLPPSKYTEFLDVLNKHKGNLNMACKEYDLHLQAVRNIMTQEPMLSHAINQIKEYHKQKSLEELENVSLENAKIPRNFSERAFQLKAMDPGKYRERTQQQNTQVNVMVAGTPIKDRVSIIEKLEERVAKN